MNINGTKFTNLKYFISLVICLVFVVFKVFYFVGDLFSVCGVLWATILMYNKEVFLNIQKVYMMRYRTWMPAYSYVIPVLVLCATVSITVQMSCSACLVSSMSQTHQL